MNTVDWREKSTAYFLWLIREGKAKSIAELFRYIVRTENLAPIDRSILQGVLHGSISGLIAAGLLKEVEGKLVVTNLLSKVQRALGLSLTQLAEASRSALWVNPLFGPPRSGTLAPEVFVLMPFASELQPVYTDHIRNVAKKLKFSAGRADDFFTTHAIIQDIWAAIVSCKVIISDCSGRNPNVFYETGIAHTLGRPVVLITQQLDDIPFDLRHLRVIEYSLTPRGMKAFEAKLYKTLTSYFTDVTRITSRPTGRKPQKRGSAG